MPNEDLSIPTLPSETPALDKPPKVAEDRDLAKEKENEAKADKAKADSKINRFAPTKRSTPQAASNPEFETLILSAAVNLPPAIFERPAPSTFVPNLAPIFYILNYMDFLMCSTKRWTDNCMGWVPPYSQMYIGVLLYVQVMRSMEAAGNIAPGSQISNVLLAFNNLFPMNELWIPGPLVNAFKSISAFQPFTNNLFGNVTPMLPASPGWTAARHHRLGAVFEHLLPNISIFISRLRVICTTAVTANMTEMDFMIHQNGPNATEGYFGHSAANSANLTASPGASLIYGGSLQLWQNASTRINFMRVPADLVAATPTIDEWTSVMRFDQFANEHIWFGPVSAMMAKYCQFFNGSAPLSSCPPTTSAAPAVKCRTTGATDLMNPITVTAAAGNGTSHTIGNANAAAVLILRNNARFIINARNVIPDLPDAHYFSGITFGLNAYQTQAHQNAMRNGDFWTIAPDYSGRDNIEVMPGLLAAITREYHSDTRLSPFKKD
jgi:hypothetical protein